MIYDVKCKACGHMEEIVRKVEDRDKDLPEHCGQTMVRIISLSQRVHSDIAPYLDENLGPDPVWVKSKKHRKQLMREAGVSEKFGKGWL